MISENRQKAAAVLYADPDKGVLGLPSRIGDALAGVAVLRRTLSRLERVTHLNDIIIYCPANRVETIRKASAHLDVHVKGVTQADLNESVVRRRKWAISSWRGGLGDATNFDEQPFTLEMVQHLQEEEVQVVISVPPEAVLVDPQLLDNLIQHHITHADEMRFTFAHTAPGLSCCLFRIDLLADLVQAGTSIGTLLAYQPDSPRSDYINHNCTFSTDPLLCSSRFRFLADTQRSFQLFDTVLQEGQVDLDTPTVEIVKKISRLQMRQECLPREIEIEVNTQRSYRINGYPHGNLQGQRPPMTIATFEKIISDCTAFDDICLTIGGFGEPLLHPDLVEMIATAKAHGIFGINIETDGRHLNGDMASALLSSQADTLTVYLDANSKEMYRSVKGEDFFDAVIENVESFVRQTREQGGPTVIPHMVKTRATLPEMEAFYDRWLRACGHAVVTGFNDYCGQIEDAAIMDMSSPNRSRCRRVFGTLTLLADGKAVLCGQDFSGSQIVGDVHQTSVGQIWQSETMMKVRNDQAQGNYDGNPLCAKCKEWHR